MFLHYFWNIAREKSVVISDFVQSRAQPINDLSKKSFINLVDDLAKFKQYQKSFSASSSSSAPTPVTTIAGSGNMNYCLFLSQPNGS